MTRWREQQDGQMLVGVMVLMAIIFLLGSAMALGVSGSLHQVDQGASQDASRYGAESAVARGLAAITSAPVVDGCGSSSSIGSPLNGQVLQVQPCFITQVDAGAGQVRYSSKPETLLQHGACLSVLVNGGTAKRDTGGNGDEEGNNGSPGVRQGRAWTTLAWRSTNKIPAQLSAFAADELDGCSTSDGDGDPPMTCALSSDSSPAYFNCLIPMTDGKKYYVKILNNGGPAIVSDFVVRDAAAGHDCVATAIGMSQAAIDEGDLILPGTPADNPTTCGIAGATVGLRNRLMP